MGEKYFKSVRALPDYKLEVAVETGATIFFDFSAKLNTARFGKLKDEELFRNVTTDGIQLIFRKTGKVPLIISAKEFMDLVLVDRTKPSQLEWDIKQSEDKKMP